MEHFDLTWQTSDGLRLFAQGWQPEDPPRAVVCLVHGLGEHSERYAHVGAALTQAGYALLGFDLRGHGKSEGPRGHAPSFQALMDDISQLLEQAGQRFPVGTRFLYGHSLGGILVLNYALRRQAQLAGVIASGPGLRTSLEQQTVKLALVRVLGRIMLAVTLPSGLNPQHLCRDPEVVRAYVNDPLVHDRLSLGMALSLLQAIRWAFEHAPEFPVPLLLMHGTADRLAFAEGSREYASLVQGDCTLKLWEGLYHEIHNEPEQRQVFETMIAWLDAHTSA